MRITVYRQSMEYVESPDGSYAHPTFSKEEHTGRVTLADDEIIVDFDHAPLAHYPASSLVLLTQHHCIIHLD